jgi:hypothetical protein
MSVMIQNNDFRLALNAFIYSFNKNAEIIFLYLPSKKIKKLRFMKERDSYKLGKVQVTITETDRPNKLKVECFDGEYQSEFTVSEYEFTNYRRLMNQRITQAYKSAGEENEQK